MTSSYTRTHSKRTSKEIRALSGWPEPHNIKTLRSFLGLTSYYRCSIKDYAKMVKPLNDPLVGHPTNKHVATETKKKKLDVTGHRWLAALSTYNFTLKNKSGKINNNADGLPRRPPENVILHQDAIQAICIAYTVKRTNCPYAETLVVTCASQLPESVDSCVHQDSDSTELSSINWLEEQEKDPVISKVL